MELSGCGAQTSSTMSFSSNGAVKHKNWAVLIERQRSMFQMKPHAPGWLQGARTESDGMSRCGKALADIRQIVAG
jgi:hypothetical protein